MKNDDSLEKVLEGVLSFHSETGTEGGYWAFQDSRFIQKNVPRGYCKNCGFYMKDQSNSSIRVTRITVLDEKVVQELLSTGKISEKPLCDKHEEEIGEYWDYEGLHILKDGDRLTIYNPDNKIEIWAGIINLKQYDSFTEGASGMWIHADQIGVERNTWAEYFFRQLPAKLTREKKQ